MTRYCLLFLTTFTALGASVGSADEARPNFVFFITDDIAPDDLGCYGNQAIRTPNLDALAGQGLVFDNAYLTISSCSPSRCSIITGRYPHNTGAPELHSPLPADQQTFVQVFRDAGYYTLLSGKNHMAPPEQLGFEVASDSQPAGSENWLAHLRDRPRDRPFFFWLASHDAHFPWQINDEAPVYDPDEVAVPPMLFDGPLTRQELASYYHEVSRTDHYAGLLLEELERQSIADNTYFVYCSDNGRPFPRCKTYLYDSGIKTPLIVRGPGVARGRTQSLVSSIDFSATFLDLARLAQPETVQGVSFARILRDPAATVREVVFAERNWHVYQCHERAVRTADWLYIWNGWPEKPNVSGESAVPLFPAAKELWEMAAEGRLTEAQALLTQVPQPTEMLFHVGNDPYQLTNLAEYPEHAGFLRNVRALLARWQEETGDSMPERPTPNRQLLHERVERTPPRGEMAGEATGATKTNAPGPIGMTDFFAAVREHEMEIRGFPPRSREYDLQGQATIAMVTSPPSQTRRNRHYVSNRGPLKPSPFVKLPIGAIRPEGWLRRQLELQADGMCGHLPEISAFCGREGNAWLTGDPDGHGNWEEVPYWLKGFGDLGYILDDPRILAETDRWVEAMLDSQRDDGWFGPVSNLASKRSKSSIPDEVVRGRPDMWPNALMLSALRSRYQAQRDPRILEFMTRYCRWLERLPEEDYLIHWVAKRRGIELLRNILWLYNVTGEEWLLELASKTHRRTNDWTSGISRYHCVDMSECFAEPALYSLVSGERADLDAAERNRRVLYHEFGQVPGGMFCGDELARPGYVGPRQAIETCAMVEMMQTCEMMFTDVTGEVRWADRCEDVAFNSLPAATTADMKALRYLTAPNHVVSDAKSKNPDINNGGRMYMMTPHAHRCCQHNHAHGWPYYAEHLWLATPDDGLCAMLYSASRVTAKVADGEEVTLTEETHYPMDDTVTITVNTEHPVEFPLYLRVPGWCDAPRLAVDEEEAALEDADGRYLRITRTWRDGDVVRLTLPMAVRLRNWPVNGDCVSVDRGPLTYSLAIGERFVRTDVETTAAGFDAREWPEWEIFPTTPWNYGLVLDEDDPAAGFTFSERPWPEDAMPWTQASVPVMLTTTARRIPGWTLQENNLVGAMQRSPILSDEPEETITLLPMGACRLRLSAFPTIGTGREARPWQAPKPEDRLAYETGDGRRLVISHLHERETLAAAVDGVLPKSSGDQNVSRVTFWPHRGTTESLRIEFDEEREVRGIEVYWFDDTGRGRCRVPASATLRTFAGDQWIPTLPSADVPVEIDRMNRLEIEPVKTTALELVVQLQDGSSSGILEVRVLP